MRKRFGMPEFLALCLLGLCAGSLLGQIGQTVKLSHVCGIYMNCPASSSGVSDSTGQQVTCNLNTSHSFRICSYTGNPSDQCPPKVWYCSGTYGIFGYTCQAYFEGCPP
jgi:hypothetical protein